MMQENLSLNAATEERRRPFDGLVIDWYVNHGFAIFSIVAMVIFNIYAWVVINNYIMVCTCTLSLVFTHVQAYVYIYLYCINYVKLMLWLQRPYPIQSHILLPGG